MDMYQHISFRRDWDLTPPTIYMLGECEALVRIISQTPLRPQERKRLLEVSLIKGAQATTAIEGNTLSQEEVEKVFEGEKLPPSREYLQKEVSNVIEAFNILLKEVVLESKEWPITPELLRWFHEMISKDLGEHLDAIPGRWREDRRTVGPYLTPDHRYIPELVDKLCGWLRDEFHFHREQDFQTAVIQAIVTHVYIEWIHPFGDGNGRTGRLTEFYILLRAGLPSITSHILSNFYNLTRTEYYRHLNNCRKERNLTKFIEYAVQGFRDGLIENMEIIQMGQLKIFWRNHVYGSFSNYKYTKKGVFLRKRDLMLAMPIDKLLSMNEMITTKPEVTIAYSQLGRATLTRDINELIEMGLLIKDKESQKYSANIHVLQESLPDQKLN